MSHQDSTLRGNSKQASTTTIRLSLPQAVATLTIDAASFVSLTDLWKAAGSDPNKAPAQWIRHDDTAEFVNALCRNLNVALEHIWKSRRGKHLGGVWAHWQIGLAYAKYLSPEVHLAMNQAYVEWCEEHRDPGLKMDRAIDGYIRQGKAIGWIGDRLEGKIVRKQWTGEFGERDCDEEFYRIGSNINNSTLIGETAAQFKESRGLPSNAAIRDHFTQDQLTEMRFAEYLDIQRAKAIDARGNAECINVVSRCAQIVKKAISAAKKGA